jgi:hydroxyethylthiazole kinase-like uncharacterized protein yjeF
MSDRTFYTPTGTPVRAITAEQMRKVDRIAVDEFGLGILQMMENAGRSLALHVVELLGQLTPCVENAHRPEDGEMSQDTSKETSRKTSEDTVVVFAGSGGNGGGGLCCARHLHNRGVNVNVALSKDASRLTGAARTQLDTLQAAGLRPLAESEVPSALARASVVVDALIGYSQREQEPSSVQDAFPGRSIRSQCDHRRDTRRRDSPRSNTHPCFAQDRPTQHPRRALPGRHWYPSRGLPLPGACPHAHFQRLLLDRAAQYVSVDHSAVHRNAPALEHRAPVHKGAPATVQSLPGTEGCA